MGLWVYQCVLLLISSNKETEVRLLGKVAIVTGAASGIGAAIATAFLKEGARVVIADRNVEGAQQVAEQSGAAAEQWLVVQVDVAAAASVRSCLQQTLGRFGTLDILVNNAGVLLTRKPFLERTEEDYDQTMQINSRSVFVFCLEAGKVMAKKGGGAIINTSSISAVVANPNAVDYGASKGAVASMTRHMAVDLGRHNVRVNAIAPGTIITGITHKLLEDQERVQEIRLRTPLQRLGRPEDLVGAAIYLASDESAFVTGTHLFVDGGWTAQSMSNPKLA